MESPIYNAAGKKTGDVTLPDAVFGVAWNDSLMHQVVTAMQANARPTVAHVKNRGDVRGGGKKPWAQKGTGRARHGSSRSPIWKGGGVTHGPRKDRDYSQIISKKVRYFLSIHSASRSPRQPRRRNPLRCSQRFRDLRSSRPNARTPRSSRFRIRPSQPTRASATSAISPSSPSAT